MAYVTQMTSIIVYVVFHLISSLFICTRADVISECANATSCIGTYADIYKSLASDVNSFNIKSALYPANEPSSVLIFVNIYGQNGPDKTGNDSMPAVMKYIWSLRSLYAAFSAVFLEISSLFSILRNPRTQELNITIPFFCCNVSVKDRKRMIKTVLAAVSISISYLYQHTKSHSRIQDVSAILNEYVQKFRKVSDESSSLDETQDVISHEVFFQSI